MMFTYLEEVEKLEEGYASIPPSFEMKEKKLEIELVKQALNCYCKENMVDSGAIDLKNIKWFLSKLFVFDIEIKEGKDENSFSCIMQDGTEQIVLDIAISHSPVI